MPPTQIIFTGTYRWKSFAIFNANAYPDATKYVVDACGLRLALVFLYTAGLSRAVAEDRAELRGALERQREDVEKAVSGRPDHTIVAVSDGLAYLADIFSCLTALKSFLDLYAKLIGKLIGPQNKWSFNKGIVEGTEIVGGRFVNNLRNCSGETFVDGLATLTLEQIRDWINTAVVYRDQLSHKSNLDHMTHMHLPLYNGPPHFRMEEIVEPRMPNGESVERYFEGLLELLLEYIRRSIVLVPNVDLKHINPDGLISDSAGTPPTRKGVNTTKFIKQTFLDQTIDLDFQVFEDCQFENCKMVYRGFGAVSMGGCSFKKVEWVFADAARNTVSFMSSMYGGAGSGGKELIKRMFEGITKGRV